MAAHWSYIRGGKQFGPVSASVIKQLVEAGELLATDLIMKEGTGRWRPAAAVKGLFLVPEVKPPDVPGPEAANVPDTQEPEGRLELPGFTKFLCVNQMGLPVLLLGGFAFMSLLVLAKEKASDDAGFKWFLMAFLDVIYCCIVIPGWLMERAARGSKSACPRCKAWFSKLLITRELAVLDSEEQTRHYTALNPIRDDTLRIVGYVDEQRSRPVTVKTVMVDMRYRCKTCGHRWENNEVEKVVI